MSRAREQANLSSDSNIFVDIANDRTGIGITTPSQKLEIDGNIKLGDNQEILIGTGSDLKLWHDGTHSYVRTTSGTQNLYLQTTNGQVVLGEDGGHIGLYYQAGGAVELRYNNIKTFETVSGGAKVTGDLDVTGNIDVADNVRIKLGTGDDLSIWHSGTHSYIQNSTGSLLVEGNSVVLRSIAQENYLVGTANGSVDLYYDGAKILETAVNRIIVTGNASESNAQFYTSDGNRRGALGFTNSNEVTLYSGTSTKALQYGSNSLKLYYNDSKKFETTSSGIDVTGIVQCDEFKLLDNEHAKFGTGEDLRIYHDSSHSWVKNSTGYLRLAAGGSGVTISNADNTQAIAQFVRGGSVDLYYNNSLKFATTSSGISVTGSVIASSTVKVGDSVEFIAGDGNDLRLWHNATDSYIKNYTGDLWIQGDGDDIHMRAADDITLYTQTSDTAIACIGDGAVELYHNGTKKFNTHADGIEVLGKLYMADNKNIELGNSQDFKIYHDSGGNSYIKETGTGFLSVQGSEVHIRGSNDENGIKVITNDRVEIYHDNSKKFETTSSGAKVTGNLEVTGVLTYDDVTNIDSVGIVTARAGVKIPDGQNLTLGTDGDVGIKHQSGHFEINNATGNTYFQTNGQIRLRGKHSGSTEEMIVATAGSSVDLYHDNSLKFATTSTGISITGVPVATQSTGNVGLDLHATGSGRGSQTKYHNDHGEAYVGTAGDTTGNFLIHNSSNSHMLFATNNTERLRITAGGYVGVKRSTPLANLHTTNNELAIGANPTSAAAPNATYDGLVVDGEAASFINIRSRGNGSDSYGRLAFSDDVRSRAYVEYRHKDGDGDDTMRFATAGSERLRIDSSGNVTISTGNLTIPDSIIHSGDTDTKIVFTNNQIDFVTGGSSRMYANNYAVYVQSGLPLAFLATSGATPNIKSGGTNNQDLLFTTGSGNPTRLQITSDGKLLVGHTAAYGSGKAQVFNTAQYVLDLSTWSADANGPTIDFYKSRNATIGSSTVVQSGDVVGKLRFLGNDGANSRTAAQITAEVDGTPGTNDMPGRLVFSTVPDNSTSVTERLRITSGGDVSVSSDGTVHGISKLTIKPANRTTAFSASDGDTWHDVVIKHEGDAANNAVGLAFEVSPSAYHKNAGTGIAAVKNGTGSDYGSDLAFITRGQSVAASEKLRIHSTGVVQIGDSTASSLGDRLLQIGKTNRSATYLELRTSTTGVGGIVFSDGTASDNTGYRGTIEYDHGATVADSMLFKTAATERLRINNLGEVTIGTGNAGNSMSEFGSGTGGLTLDDIGSSHTALRLSHGSDDTYLVQASNNNFYISQYGTGSMIFGVGSSGNERLRINSSGQLIMTNAATQTFFDFSTTNNSTRGLFSIAGKDSSGNAVTVRIGGFGDTNRGEIFTHSNHGLGFATNNAATQMILDTSGRLLLGTTTEGHSSADDLTVATSGSTGITVRSGTSNDGSIFFADGTSGDSRYRGWIQYTHSSDYLTFGIAANERLRIDSGGKVGVGQAPNTKFNVALSSQQADGTDDASDWGAGGIFQLDATNSGTGNEILLLGAHSGGVGQIASGFGFGRENSSNWGTYLSFKTHSTSTSNIDELTERLRITSDGRSNFKKDAGSTNNAYSIAAEINAKTSGSAAANFGPALYLTHTFGGTNYAGSLITSQTDADVNTTHISFYPRNYGWTEALRITAAGRIGIGVATPGCKLNVKASGSESDGLQVTSSGHSSYVWQIQNNNNLFNGSLAGELGIRGSSGISFSANAGTSTHFRIASSGNITHQFSGRYGYTIGSTNGSGAYIVLDGAEGTPLASGSDYFYMEHTSNGQFEMWNGNASSSTAKFFNATKEGYVTKPKTPYFHVQASPEVTNSPYDNGVKTFDNIRVNNGSHYNNSTGVFTCPVAGFYWFSGGIWASNSDNSSGSYILMLVRRDSNGNNQIQFAGANHRTYQNQLTVSAGYYCATGDKIYLEWNGSIQGSTPRNYFSGCLIA